MRRIFSIAAFSTLLAVAVLGQAASTPPPLALKVGDMAPEFTLVDMAGKRVTLSEFRGKSNVVLAFYVFAFTGG